MQQQLIKVSQLKNNTGQVEGLPKNPRLIRDEKFDKLKKSLEDDPEMMQLREVIAYDNNGELVVICGNMRLRALKDLGVKEVPVKVLPTDTPIEKLKAYTIKDNVPFGEHDWSDLANEWDAELLADWGIDVPNVDGNKDDTYTKKIEAPLYEPKTEKPETSDLFDTKKHDELVSEINKASGLTDDEKQFLLFAAKRHVVFDYENIAEFYAHSSKDVQELMERSALVIIDYNQAIEDGYVKLSKDLFEQYEEEHGN